jgi:NADH-quinone oxidoreductase subunit G
MPKVTINGKELDAPDGVNLIRAAEMVGIEIPHYCYHPGLTVVGNCRMCLVEIDKMPKLQIACNTKVADGMVVHTDSERAKRAQAAVLEFLLINHPIDCPICDQAGECKLQDYYMDYDRRPSRFALGKKNKKGKAIDLGSDIMLDQERCILCARCTRFFDEITKTHELAIFERGDHCVVDTYPDRKIENKYACNVVDICPVGALTEKDFRFRMRVWYLHRTPSICAGCERGCSIDIHHQRGRIYRFKPRYNPEVNGYWICDEGRHSFVGLQGESRLGKPLVQSKDRLVSEPWPEAIRRAAARISEYRQTYGPDSIGAIIDAHCANEEAFLLKRLMAETIGSRNLVALSYTLPGASPDDDLLIRGDKNPNTRGLVALGLPVDGLDRLTGAVASGELKMLIALRADPARALGEAEFVRRFGGLDYLIVLDTDATLTAQMANQVLPIGAYPEVDGSFTNFQGRVQRINKAFEPPGEALSALEAIARISHALDGKTRSSSADVVFAEMAAAEQAFGGLSLAGLAPHGAMLRSATPEQSASAE